MGMNEDKKKILTFIEENNQTFCDSALDIWHHPELGLQEFYAFDRLTGLLEESGFTVERGAAGIPTAFVATYGEGKPVIGFSSEFDALPGLSQKKDVNAKEPIMEGAPGHGCGHNLLSSGGIQAAVAVKNFMEENQIKGTLKVFGTPAEEICVGKPFMARAGLFKGLDAVLDWHPAHRNAAYAVRCNAYFNVKYHFSGKSAHGNAPWKGISALDSTMLMGHAIELLREHIEPGEKGAESTLNYAFPDCGNAFPVVVPDRSSIWVVGRFENADICQDVLAKVKAAAEGCAMAIGTTVKEEFITATHDMIENHTLAEAGHKNYLFVGPPRITEEDNENAKEIQKELGFAPTGYSKEIVGGGLSIGPVTDSSEYSWHAPLGFFEAALVPEFRMMGHNWMMVRCAGSHMGIEAMTTASKVIALTAYDLLTDPALLETAQKEFRERLNGRVYKTLIPEDCELDLNTNKEMMDKFR